MTPPATRTGAAGKPIVLVPACNRVLGQQLFHVVAKKYIDAVWLAGCQPLVVPGADPGELDELLGIADGVLLTGSPSNVHPSHYAEDVLDESLPLDRDRDAWTLPIVPKALGRGMPLFAICRGFQEANVALGGTLHQAVHRVDGLRDHRDRDDDPIDVQYAVAHDVSIEPGGVLAGLLGKRSIAVNSLHGQGIKRLAPGLRVEARAPDGLIEAFSAKSSGFALAVQWHPEWHAERNPVSMSLLRAFGDAARRYRAEARAGAAVREASDAAEGDDAPVAIEEERAHGST
ncbi:MAG TPA: gamma-glutamyl-gamma-aminobutyrate hydrolase family protein [Caldimonas sp.]|nr:gamma-glutamyl-gamma-aminobutyrate hydrolase family protein [Caldimonas sp.]HEX2539504.1 gamma-glutamyl-gamma-aminobutyrate hydrolase family protein [Caldimonas sp.]